MKWEIVVPVATALIVGSAAIGSAEQKDGPSSVVGARSLTREQFQALPLEAVIDIDGKRMTKRQFIEHRTRALEQALHAMPEKRARLESEFNARREAFLASENAKVREANRKVEAEIARLVAADAAARRK